MTNTNLVTSNENVFAAAVLLIALGGLLFFLLAFLAFLLFAIILAD